MHDCFPAMDTPLALGLTQDISIYKYMYNYDNMSRWVLKYLDEWSRCTARGSTGTYAEGKMSALMMPVMPS